MMVFKRKQVIVLALVLMIVVAGYLQYSYKKSSVSVSGKDDGRLGEAVYVENEKETAGQGSDVKNDGKATSKDVGASKQANDFFAQAKLDKEVVRSKDKDTLQQITKDENASKEVKAKAYDKMMAIVENSQKEQNIETLVKEKGFDDVVALFAEDGSLDIIVKSPGLTSAQVAQITDIATRHAKLDVEKVHIKNVF
jgi:stage III sporulation protein AH